jgi:hypothetical protein
VGESTGFIASGILAIEITEILAEITAMTIKNVEIMEIILNF